MDRKAFFEGHVHAFHFLGGVPAGRIKYDNLKAAVAQVIGFSRQRVETDRWIAFCSHWDIDPWYCQPGQEGAHEKGGVEGDVGWFAATTWSGAPGRLDRRTQRADRGLRRHRRQTPDRRQDPHRRRSVRLERTLLKPVPVEPFETGLWLTPRVDRFAQVTVRSNRYSVPARLIGRQVRVLLHASTLAVYEGRVLVTEHERLLGRGRIGWSWITIWRR